MEKYSNTAIAVILKGICHSMLAMVKPSLTEINKMLEEFGMELIIKPIYYHYRSFPCMNFTWYVSGSDQRPDGSGHGILEWCINEDDACRILADMTKFSHFTDLKIGNTEWETTILNEVDSAQVLKDLNFGYLLDKPTSQSGEFVLTFEEAINYLKENQEGKVTYESAKYRVYVTNSYYNGYYALYDHFGFLNPKWYDGDNFSGNQFYTNEKWAIVA